MRQSRGWADIYDASTPGNYVDFVDRDGTPLPSGRYLMRTTVDPDNQALETNDDDNVGYAYIEVAIRSPLSSSTVTMLERGRGLDPGDPHKIVLSNGHSPPA